jgi:hypothetical protein
MRLSQEDQQIRYFIIQHFIQQGTAPSTEELCAQLGQSAEEVQAALKRHENAHALVLAPATYNIWMMHPFSAVPTHHIVHTEERDYWANCGWDLLGVPVVVGTDSVSHVGCEHCDEQIEIVAQVGGRIMGEAVVHFTVPARRFWDNVGYT